ncbi:hypothetical protein CCACVL1_11078 [Corchorus capsularis]|uniref:Uncharacterized protein n=1 Tax=Corchorus capsularis TaxID=210143 RepID=A0A1R3IN19_COCAP|nr:hypothetical protein CCACVL1_11078 [Corchorus capsularis]
MAVLSSMNSSLPRTVAAVSLLPTSGPTPLSLDSMALALI